ncbi:hypothetical protein CGMCC3_g14898 [Colletotrichum fructicola]|nr:uncharacterized protein CGMCC3_g14898 [Colletotrichum fructicola]KAE9568972.1 hypothetical protein CGMCC3_g14898 [Colletotrichum fructicola]
MQLTKTLLALVSVLALAEAKACQFGTCQGRFGACCDQFGGCTVLSNECP